MQKKWTKIMQSMGMFAAIAVLMSASFAPYASARILFQDDIFSEDDSEGFMFNADDGGDEDVTLQLGNDGTDGEIVWDDGTSTLNIGDGVGSISLDSNIWDISAAGVASGLTGITSTGAVNFSGANRLAVPSGAANPAACTEGDVFYNSTDNIFYVCTAANTWSASGPQDFESVYGTDADNTLTAAAAFTIDAVGAVNIDSDAAITVGGAGIALTSDGGALALNGDGAADIDIANAGAAIDMDSATFTLDTTAAATITTGAAFTLNGNSTAINSTVGDVTITSADDIIFDDAQLTGVVQLTATATDWVAALPSDGIIDNINAFTTVNNGEGASLIGLEDAGGNFTATNVEAALTEFTSNANGEGASIVGIEDAGANFTATDVEGALTELAAAVSGESETMRFYPEYANAVYAGGKGKLRSIDDGAEGNTYRWTTRRTTDQTMIITTRFELPEDFDTGADMTMRYSTANAAAADNTVAAEMYNVTDTQSCGSIAAASSVAWATGTLGAAAINGACTQDAGDIVEIRVSLMANDTNDGEAYVGYLDYDYAN